MHLYVIRHTTVNVENGTCYGQTDVGLTDSFEDETTKIYQKLEGVEFQSCYSSPLYRCVSLSKVLQEKLKLPPFNTDERIIELSFGEWEGKIWNDIEKTEQAKTWFTDWVSFPTPNGESYRQLVNRVQMFLNELKCSNLNGNVLIVTHGGVVRAINAIINKIALKDAFDLNVDFCQIIEFKL